MPQRDGIWLALRTPRGDLESLDEMCADSMVNLAIQAGLQGLSLEEWLLTILQVSIERESREEQSIEEKMGGHWIELKPKPALLEVLQRRYNADEFACNLGDYVNTFLYFISYPGQVLEASRLLRKKVAPATVAHRLIEQAMERMEMEHGQVDMVEQQEQRRFVLELAAGHYAQALKRTGFQRQARRLATSGQEGEAHGTH